MALLLFTYDCCCYRIRNSYELYVWDGREWDCLYDDGDED
jgi:hypothetical protein